jgi:hypothetical protein
VLASWLAALMIRRDTAAPWWVLLSEKLMGARGTRSVSDSFI